MKPVLFEGHDIVLGAPKGWNLAKDGPCDGLPIMRDRGRCISQWDFTEDERVAIAGGARLYLTVLGDQPPVIMQVGRPATNNEREMPITLICGDGTPQGSIIIHEETGRGILNVRGMVLFADAPTGLMRAYLTIYGDGLDLGEVVEKPIGITQGVKCTATIAVRIPIEGT